MTGRSSFCWPANCAAAHAAAQPPLSRWERSAPAKRPVTSLRHSATDPPACKSGCLHRAHGELADPVAVPALAAGRPASCGLGPAPLLAALSKIDHPDVVKIALAASEDFASTGKGRLLYAHHSAMREDAARLDSRSTCHQGWVEPVPAARAGAMTRPHGPAGYSARARRGLLNDLEAPQWC
jgi:hypothetical protein